jgi:hypothetical protein
MSTAHAIQTAFEILMIGLLAVGFLYEPSLAQWERKKAKQGERMLKELKARKGYRK